jgi:hypothetical protein
MTPPQSPNVQGFERGVLCDEPTRRNKRSSIVITFQACPDGDYGKIQFPHRRSIDVASRRHARYQSDSENVGTRSEIIGDVLRDAPPRQGTVRAPPRLLLEPSQLTAERLFGFLLGVPGVEFDRAFSKHRVDASKNATRAFGEPDALTNLAVVTQW